MSYLLSGDPGLRKCGAALWRGVELVGAGLVEPEDRGAYGAAAVEVMSGAMESWVQAESDFQFLALASSRVVCECPQTYGGRAGQGDANDLIAVALVVGAVLGRLGCPSRLVLPCEWKGSIKKPETRDEYERDGYVVEERNKAKLSEEEYRRIEWPRAWKKRLDVADAVGIGLYVLGR